MRLMALDVGTKTIGIAMTDPLAVIAQPHDLLRRTTLRGDLAHVIGLIERYEVDLVLVGLPVSDGGEETPMSRLTRSFAAQLQKKLRYSTRASRCPEVLMWDERYSTQDAESLLVEAEVPKSERKKYIDKIAATLILESYMNR